MSVQSDTANYCPNCGAEVENAEIVGVEDDLAVQGVFEQQGAHLVIEGSIIKIFEHADSPGGDN